MEIHIENKKETDIFTNDEIKDLKKLINQLHENEHIEIFKIIKSDTDKYTENRNGIFINMSKLNNNTLKKILNFVNFCNENKKSFQYNKDKMETIKNLVSEENNDNLSNQDNESIENIIESDYKVYNVPEKYNYTNKVEINLNQIEESLLKESINIIENEKNIKKKKKYTGVKGRIIKKSRDNTIINNTSTINTKPILLNKREDINIYTGSDNNENKGEYEDEGEDYEDDEDEYEDEGDENEDEDNEDEDEDYEDGDYEDGEK